MYKHLYSKFLKAHPKKLHFAAHSHHLWPDVTQEAHNQYWIDSMNLVDEKWSYFFSTKVPQVQKQISDILNISKSEQIVFAPNTHELIFRLLSSFDFSKPLKILTTDSEFYSFNRQALRLSENKNILIKKISAASMRDFENNMLTELRSENWDLVFFSHVFFNSGLAAPLDKILNLCKEKNILTVVDAYHSFCALPIDWSPWQDHIFYLAGGYKYAQGGEGACFMYAPSQFKLRPLNTGWFAELTQLENIKETYTSYPDNALRFAGSTLDLTALYRLEASLGLFKNQNLTTQKIHEHVQSLQKYFLNQMQNLHLLEKTQLLFEKWESQGHFITFDFKDEKLTNQFKNWLKSKNVIVDTRGSRLRFGFGLYHNTQDVDELIQILNLREIHL